MAVAAITAGRSVALICMALFLASCGTPKYLGQPANEAVARASKSTTIAEPEPAAPKRQQPTKRPTRRAATAAAVTSQADSVPPAGSAATNREVTTASITPLPRTTAAAESWQQSMGSRDALAVSPTLPASLWCSQPMTSCTGLWAPNPNVLSAQEPAGLASGFVPVE